MSTESKKNNFKTPNIGKCNIRYSVYVGEDPTTDSAAPIKTLFGTLAGKIAKVGRNVPIIPESIKPSLELEPSSYPRCSDMLISKGIIRRTRPRAAGMKNANSKPNKALPIKALLNEPCRQGEIKLAILVPKPVNLIALPITNPENIIHVADEVNPAKTILVGEMLKNVLKVKNITAESQCGTQPVAHKNKQSEPIKTACVKTVNEVPRSNAIKTIDTSVIEK